jgi:hypothetical protein
MNNTRRPTDTRLARPGWRRLGAVAVVALGLALIPGTAAQSTPGRTPAADASAAGFPAAALAGGSAAASVTTPSARMHDLDFLFGPYKCEVSGNSTVGNSTIYIRTRPTLSGHYYQLELSQVKPDQPDVLHGRWVIGWSEAESQFVSFYYDENLMHGSSTSPGRQGANVTFTGDYVLGAKGVFTVRDDFVVHSDRHFEIQEYLKISGQWVLFDIQDCRWQ